RFLSFTVLDRVTGCVVPVPTTDAEFARLQKSGTGTEQAPEDAAAAPVLPPVADAGGTADGRLHTRPPNDMVTIPGGPVKLPVGVLTDYHEMTREMVACVPEFKMDRYKVSNREYYAFWNGLSRKER